jgi:hypothetical protein
MDSKPLRHVFRMSLRELLAIFTAAAIGFIALRFADQLWLAAVWFLTLAAFIAATTYVLVDRGARQALAIGFVLGAGIYLGVLYSRRSTHGNSGWVKTSNAELDPYEGSLPTTLALRPLFQAITVNWYTDKSGNRVIRDQIPPQTLVGGLSRSGYSYVGEVPRREDFMRIGHCLWALLFGYAAAKFSLWVYVRRVREQVVATPPGAS